MFIVPRSSLPKFRSWRVQKKKSVRRSPFGTGKENRQSPRYPVTSCESRILTGQHALHAMRMHSFFFFFLSTFLFLNSSSLARTRRVCLMDGLWESLEDHANPRIKQWVTALIFVDPFLLRSSVQVALLRVCKRECIIILVYVRRALVHSRAERCCGGSLNFSKSIPPPHPSPRANRDPWVKTKIQFSLQRAMLRSKCSVIRVTFYILDI